MPHTSNKEKLSNLREIEFLSSCDHRNIVAYKRAYSFKDEIWVRP
jgi:hypothetical protein